MEKDGKCDKTWKQALKGKKHKKCRNGLDSANRNDKVKEWCEESCGECGKLNIISINQINSYSKTPILRIFLSISLL